MTAETMNTESSGIEGCFNLFVFLKKEKLPFYITQRNSERERKSESARVLDVSPYPRSMKRWTKIR